MRKLTLQEKISIKGILSHHGMERLAGLTMEQAVHCFPRCTGRPVCYFNTQKRWHKTIDYRKANVR